MTLARFRIFLAGLAALSLSCGWASAQTNDDVFAGLQFSFAPPGARSLAMGGAFVGRADDATAAYSNPAGLLWLERPEVSFETRSSSYTTEYLNGGRISGAPSGVGADTFGSPQFTDFESDTLGVSFLSYARPAKSGKWAVALYRHELANFEVDLVSQGLFRGAGPAVGKTGSLLGDLDLLIENFGVSGAFALTKRLWVGLGVSYYEIDIDGRTRRYEHESLFEPARFTAPQEFLTRRMVGDDGQIGLIGGLLWRSENRRWSAGTVYREGPEFDVFTTFTFGPLAFARNRTSPAVAARTTGPTTFRTPDVLAVGFSVRATDSLTVSVELDRVTYSNLEPEFSVLTRENVLDQFEVDDGDEIRLGLEYLLINSRVPVALRAGAWQDPDHQLRFNGPNPEDLLRIRYRRGEDVIHLTGGVGAVLLDGRLQIDLAFDTSDRADVLTLSSVVTF